MKVTVEISDPLLRQARKLAAREGVTLKLLVERGLTQVIGEKKIDPVQTPARHLQGKRLAATIPRRVLGNHQRSYLQSSRRLNVAIRHPPLI